MLASTPVAFRSPRSRLVAKLEAVLLPDSPGSPGARTCAPEHRPVDSGGSEAALLADLKASSKPVSLDQISERPKCKFESTRFEYLFCPVSVAHSQRARADPQQVESGSIENSSIP